VQTLVLGTRGNAIGGIAIATGLPSMSSLFVPRGVTLVAEQSLSASKVISNVGTIFSSETLWLSAPAINNAGLIESLSGDINLSSGEPGNFAITNNNGVMQALNGNINIAATGMTKAETLRITGGSWLSNQVNINAGCGDVEMD